MSQLRLRAVIYAATLRVRQNKAVFRESGLERVVLTKAKSLNRFVSVVSLVLVSGGVYSAYIEVRSYFSGGMTPVESFAAVAANVQVAGLSIATNRLVVDNCYDALTSIYGIVQPTIKSRAVASNCLAQADAVTQAMPTHSFAWFVGALAALRLEDPSGFADRLRQSQLTGPREQWIAELRVGLAEDNFDLLPSDVRELNDRDLGLLVVSDRGIASIAQRYVRDEAFRERITSIVEQLSEHDQQRFVNSVGIAAPETRQSS